MFSAPKSKEDLDARERAVRIFNVPWLWGGGMWLMDLAITEGGGAAFPYFAASALLVAAFFNTRGLARSGSQHKKPDGVSDE